MAVHPELRTRHALRQRVEPTVSQGDAPIHEARQGHCSHGDHIRRSSEECGGLIGDVVGAVRLQKIRRMDGVWQSATRLPAPRARAACGATVEVAESGQRVDFRA